MPVSQQYGTSFAEVYNDWYGDLDQPAEIIAMLQALGAGPGVLELGVGTGRLALPLRDAGFAVTGLDSSLLMIEQMTDQVDGLGPDRTVGDMVDLPFSTGSFDAVLIAYNTLFNLPSAELQARCLEEVARVLRPGGVLAMDLYVPSLPPDELSYRVAPGRHLGDDVVLIGTRQHGGASLVEGVHLQFTPAGLIPRPWTVHGSTPEQIDEMAEAAGLDLHQRSADWNGSAWDPSDNRHVSVYAVPLPDAG